MAGMSGTTGTPQPTPTSLHRVRRPGRAALAGLLVGALVLAGCGSDDSDDADGTTTTAAGSATTAPGDPTAGTDTSTTTGGTDPATDQQVLVYFVRNEKLAASARTVTGEGVGAAALEAVLAGPNETESGIGFSNAVPAGTEVLGVDIADGVATVDLNDAFQSGGGSLAMQLRVAQVVATLTQFDTVETVTIRIDGEDVDGIGGEGVPAADLDRTDIEDVTPPILLESPAPGATVSSPLRITGTGNTFEATYQWEVLDADGGTVAAGFDTATSGTGTRGTFDTEIDLGDATGAITLRLFEASAKDGSEINEVTIPLTVG
jgi:hypothetical protein